MRNIRAEQGFSILEMILVSAVVATIVLFALSSRRVHQQRAILNKTSIEMQHILQAAGNYYIRQGYRWPKTMVDLLDVVEARDPGTVKEYRYLPVGSQCSSWVIRAMATPKDPYQCGPKSEFIIELPKKKNAEFGSNKEVDDKAPFISVKLQLPDEATAKRLAAEIPSAFNNQNIVYATLMRPSRAIVEYQGLNIKKITELHMDGEDEKDWQEVDRKGQQLACPVGWKSNYRLALSRIDSCNQLVGDCDTYFIGGASPLRRALVATPLINDSSDQRPDPDQTWDQQVLTGSWLAGARYQADIQTMTDSHHGRGMLIEYCIPPNYRY